MTKQVNSFKQVVDQFANVAAMNACPEQCQCLRTEVRERTIRGGSKQYVRQCLDCGESVGNPVKQLANVALFDEELKRSQIQHRADLRKAAKDAESVHWWAFYHQYMASDEWRALRGKVLARDGHLCQGCLLAKATEVHHQSYENFGREFAFELLSLCHSCHARYHGDEGGE